MSGVGSRERRRCRCCRGCCREDGAPLTLDLAMLRTLFLSGVAIALLGAIESLLSAVVADGMTHDSHDPDAEILALGIGNIVAPFFGGIAATGAIARTATNIRSGGRSPISELSTPCSCWRQ
ncbi:MAG: hypothetical protein H6683_03295 [Deltaproteobacteria bacterium]|nr:hypothetical protein [Deltaproteobacteria bacterium]